VQVAADLNDLVFTGACVDMNTDLHKHMRLTTNH
jgi:hypothetical protein